MFAPSLVAFFMAAVTMQALAAPIPPPLGNNGLGFPGFPGGRPGGMPDDIATALGLPARDDGAAAPATTGTDKTAAGAPPKAPATEKPPVVDDKAATDAETKTAGADKTAATDKTAAADTKTADKTAAADTKTAADKGAAADTKTADDKAADKGAADKGAADKAGAPPAAPPAGPPAAPPAGAPGAPPAAPPAGKVPSVECLLNRLGVQAGTIQTKSTLESLAKAAAADKATVDGVTATITNINAGQAGIASLAQQVIKGEKEDPKVFQGVIDSFGAAGAAIGKLAPTDAKAKTLLAQALSEFAQVGIAAGGVQKTC